MGGFFAVGVGPGDPELLTLRAASVVRAARRIYHAGPAHDRGRALDVVRGLLRPDQQVRTLLQATMPEARACADGSPYRAGVDCIAADCHAGLDVAFITEGDPSLYSTAGHVVRLLAEHHPEVGREIIPGVTSICAAAARVGWSLAQRDETLRVVPGTGGGPPIDELLAGDDCVCLLKAAAALPQLLGAWQRPGRAWEAAYFEELGSPGEWCTTKLDQVGDRRKYFSLVLARRSQNAFVPPAASSAGKVWVVGIGPGDAEQLTGQALRVLHQADDLVGYAGYLAQVERLGCRGCQHPLPIGAEMERVRLALELAGTGREVALVSSGDAGVYGMASLLLEAAGRAATVTVEVVPGVTAATAAAALLGAPLGHDFACISLSDLLTPWAVIERRLQAAGQGDFVVALYNPASRERTWQLARARDILLNFRPAATPVGLVTAAYRPNEQVRHSTLGDLTADEVTMETIVLVGSRTTQVIAGRLVTPRGYGAVAAPPAQSPADAGRRIMEESFAIIERELGPHELSAWAFAVVRRMIHASADFEFARTLRYSPGLETAVRRALDEKLPLVADTEMVLQGVRTAAAAAGVTVCCHLNELAGPAADGAEMLTRAAAGIRQAARQHARAVLVIGVAPTALEEALRLVEQEGWRPAAIVAMPVGFVGVEEAKRHLQAQHVVPYLTCVGRKGGSAVTAAAVNALIQLADAGVARPPPGA